MSFRPLAGQLHYSGQPEYCQFSPPIIGRLFSFSEVTDHLHLPQQSESQAHPLAVGAAGRGGHRRGLYPIRAGLGPAGAGAAADRHGAVRLSQHPAGGRQHPGFFALRHVLPVFEAAIL